MSTNRIHFISGMVLTLFTGLHLFNHVCSLWGAEAHIDMMSTLRVFYRNILFESLLMLAVVMQIYSGIKLLKVARKIQVTGFDKLHIWSGIYLAFFFILHVSAILSGRLFLQIDTNLHFAVTLLNTFPFSLYFLPYYSLAILAFFAHIAAIHYKKMHTPVLGISPLRQSQAIVLIGFLLTLVIMSGLTNQMEGFEVPELYQQVILRK